MSSWLRAALSQKEPLLCSLQRHASTPRYVMIVIVFSPKVVGFLARSFSRLRPMSNVPLLRDYFNKLCLHCVTHTFMCIEATDHIGSIDTVNCGIK